MRERLAQVCTLPFLASMFFVYVFGLPLFTHAQAASTTDGNAVYIARALITKVVSDIPDDLATTTPQGHTEIVMARILDGAERGKNIEFSSVYFQGDGTKMSQGDIMYVTRYQSDGNDPMATVYTYQSVDHYRLAALIFFIILFLACVVFIGGKQGVRGLVSLLGVICLIVFVLLPGVMHGYSPLLLSLIVASLTASIGAYVTHGFSKMTSSAVIGMLLTIIISTLLSSIAVQAGYLSGVTDENTSNLLGTPGFGSINFQALLLGGIIIGLLGVLYDAAIGQAVAVEELGRAAPTLSRQIIYGRAFRIGREHIGALVNTLILAYIGTSLPLFLSYYGYSLFSTAYYSPIINQEWFVTEIIRMTVGGIGLMLTIPITTLVAVWILIPKNNTTDQNVSR